FDRLGVSDVSEKGLQNDLFSEGIQLSKGKKVLAEYGVVAKKIIKAFDIQVQVLYADFKWDAILEEIPREDLQMKPIPKFPKVKRDFALLLDQEVTFDSLKRAALQTEKKLLKEVSLFDVYTGKKLPKGKKSYALSFTLQDDRKTLTDIQIDKIMGKLQQRFEKDFGAQLR
ncbi:MAG: phenylalanine--tRNA ligase subunit beta, partial [Flavobacteriaceae bacterium]|nr:phenylalanine--tRNA ligase subunit beta [Flavobacteriaceae bacterium]